MLLVIVSIPSRNTLGLVPFIPEQMAEEMQPCVMMPPKPSCRVPSEILLGLDNKDLRKNMSPIPPVSCSSGLSVFINGLCHCLFSSRVALGEPTLKMTRPSPSQSAGGSAEPGAGRRSACTRSSCAGTCDSPTLPRPLPGAAAGTGR